MSSINIGLDEEGKQITRYLTGLASLPAVLISKNPSDRYLCDCQSQSRGNTFVYR